jgi:hypothetical protein
MVVCTTIQTEKQGVHASWLNTLACTAEHNIYNRLAYDPYEHIVPSYLDWESTLVDYLITFTKTKNAYRYDFTHSNILFLAGYSSV